MSKRYEKIVKDLKTLGLDFRINDLDESLEVQMDGEWALLDDTRLAIIQMELEELGYGVRGKKKPPQSSAQRAWIKLADKQRYNPIQEYFNSLNGDYQPSIPVGQVSAQPRVIPAFGSAYFDNPDKMFGTWLFRWMVGCIARTFEQARNPMLVLVGPQRMGKSRFARWLCPLEDRFREGRIEPDSKDARLRLVDTFIQEVPELGSTTRRADVEALKDHITKMHVHERMPYGKLPTLKPAVCNFIGSVNPDGAGFLNDPTGSTRFLSCEINTINFSYSDDVDPKKLWSEAWWFYHNAKYAWELTKDEQDKQREINAQFEMVSALEDVVDQHLRITGDDSDYVPAIEINIHLKPYYHASNDSIFYRELAKVLYKKGCQRKREPYQKGQPHRWAWYGVLLHSLQE